MAQNPVTSLIAHLCQNLGYLRAPMLHCCVIQPILHWSDTSSDLLGCYSSLRLILVTALTDGTIFGSRLSEKRSSSGLHPWSRSNQLDRLLSAHFQQSPIELCTDVLWIRTRD